METEVGNSVAKAAGWLRQNEVVAIPTETVYGLAGNALEAAAVLKIFKAKNRPHFNPLIIHTHHWEMVSNFAFDIPEHAYRIAEAFCPGPITLLLDKKPVIPDLVTAGHTRVAVRIPAHPLTRTLLQMLDFPLAAPSANPFGYVSPTTAGHVMQGLQGLIPYVLDGGPCTIGLESTIVDFEGDKVIIRRSGGISAEQIASATGIRPLIRTHASEHPVAPGQLKSHYATGTPLYLGFEQAGILKHSGKKIAVLEFGNQILPIADYRFNLSPEGDIDTAARNLFTMMRAADHTAADVILAADIPVTGLGAAINDRLKRAMHTSR